MTQENGNPETFIDLLVVKDGPHLYLTRPKIGAERVRLTLVTMSEDDPEKGELITLIEGSTSAEVAAYADGITPFAQTYISSPEFAAMRAQNASQPVPAAG